LVTKTEPEILAYRNFGKKSLNEVEALLKTMGLSFGMNIDEEKMKKV
jgi:DNA-directed RNA polymerase subunit alpha